MHVFDRGRNKHLWNLRFDLGQLIDDRSTDGLKSVKVKAKFVVGSDEADVLERHQKAEIILHPVKENLAEPEKPVHQLQITTSTINPKVRFLI
jgi:hypothetical protein